MWKGSESALFNLFCLYFPFYKKWHDNKLNESMLSLHKSPKWWESIFLWFTWQHYLVIHKNVALLYILHLVKEHIWGPPSRWIICSGKAEFLVRFDLTRLSSPHKLTKVWILFKQEHYIILDPQVETRPMWNFGSQYGSPRAPFLGTLLIFMRW